MKLNTVKRTFFLLILATLSLAVFLRTCDLRPARAPDTELKAPTLAWDKAGQNIGKMALVTGPVVDTHLAVHTPGRPAFLNIGKPYPEQGRFTVVIWEDARKSFRQNPEEMYKGREIAVRGRIELHRGNPQIVVSDAEQIKLVK